MRDGETQPLGREVADRDGEQRGVPALRVETEGGDPPSHLALVEPVVLEIVEEIAGEPKLRRRDRQPAGELERERRLAVVQDEAILVAERPSVPSHLQHRPVSVRRHGELERPREGELASRVPLADRVAVVVDEAEAAAQPLAQDAQERLDAEAVQHRRSKSLVHLEGLGEALQLLVRQVRERRLRDRDERDVVRHGEHRETEPVGFADERLRNLVEAEPEAEAERRQPVLGEAGDVLDLALRRLADAESRGQQQLAAFEPRGRVGELGDVEPADLASESVRTGAHVEAESGDRRDLSDGQHARAFDIVANTLLPYACPCQNPMPRRPGLTRHAVHLCPRVWPARPLWRDRRRSDNRPNVRSRRDARIPHARRA